MVDIISGTSAGGINGVALAKALCIGASMESLAQVWKQKAELGNLLNSPRRRDARSLLNEEYYQSVILDVLNDMDRTASDTPLVNALDLFISATDLHGEVLELKDFLEQDVKTRQYRKKFHLKFRTSNYNPVDRGLGYDRNDFHASRNRHLVDICRATSSFPVALRPTPIQPDQTAGLDLFPRPMDSSTLYFSDGGILNNKPFGDAIKAIFGRSNKPAVDRILFYVEPDPESFRPPKVGEALAEPNFIEIASKALSGIPRYQSIATDLQDLNNRNGRIREFQIFRAHLEDKLWSEFSDRLTQLKDKGIRSTDYRDFLGQQVAHSGYQLIKLQRTEAHLGEMFDWVLNLRPLDPNHAAARSIIKEQVSELAKNEEAFLRAFDTEYRVRRYYHLIELLEEFAGNKHSAADREALENLKLRLWAGFDRARDIEWRAWTTTHEGWFRVPFSISRVGARRYQPPRFTIFCSKCKVV
jgi:patatin-related protein